MELYASFVAFEEIFHTILKPANNRLINNQQLITVYIWKSTTGFIKQLKPIASLQYPDIFPTFLSEFWLACVSVQ